MNTALLVIDVQESFRHRDYFRPDDLPTFFDRLQVLIDGAQRKGWPVVQVLHVDPEGPFSEASGFVRPMKELEYPPDLVVKKHVHSAMAGSSLPAWLVSQQISKLVVTGIRTEQCCETTTRNASDLGWSVDFVTEATLTFPMTHPRTKRLFSAAEIQERTELVLDGRFARVCTAKEALQ